MLHKNQTVLSGLNFSNFPEIFTTQDPLTVHILALGSGATVGSTGLRWWNSAILTANGSIVLPANGSFTLPFSRSFLNPGFLMDLIVAVSLNGVIYWYAASNSLDNIVPNISATNKKLFYISLYCCGLNNFQGSSLTNNHFMQGGYPTQGESLEPVNVFLSDLTTSTGSFTVLATYVSYNNTTPINAVFTKTVPYLVNQNVITLFTLREMCYYFYYTYGYLTYLHAGYYKIQVTCSDPSYTSMLAYYHYGQSN